MTFAKYPVSAGGSGDVTGPGLSTDNALVLWNGTSGTSVKNSSVLVSDIVLTSGNQTVGGLKTFSSGIAVSGGTAAAGSFTRSGTTWFLGNGPSFTEAGVATLADSVVVGGSNGVVLKGADATGSGTIRLRSNNASASARDWGFLLDANSAGEMTVYVSLTKNGNPTDGINILSMTSSLFRVVDVQTQFTRTTNQIILGTTNTTTINSTAPSASRVYTIPDAGADTSFIMGAGTNTIAGTLTLPATVNYTSNGSIVKSGNHALTLVTSGTSNATFPTGTFTLAILGANTFTAAQTITATTNQLVLGVTNTTTINSVAPAASRTYTIIDAGGAADFVMTAATQTIGGAKTFSSAVTINPASNQIVLSSGVNQLTLNSSTSAAARVYSFPDVGTTGTVAMLEGAQTFSALKTFSSGLNVSGGSAANGAVWFASNVLRQRGGTSGWAVDNTSGTAIISATDAGAVTFGPAGSTSASLNYLFRLPTAGSFIVPTGTDPQLAISSASSSGVVSILGYQNGATAATGLSMAAWTKDGNTGGDFVIDVRENDNSDFATLTNDAFKINRFGTNLVNVTRAGAVTLGPSTGSATTSHIMYNRTTTEASGVIQVIKGAAGTTTSNKLIIFGINNGGTGSGGIGANGTDAAAFTTSSDVRLKQNIAPLSGELGRILQLNPVSFDYIAGGGNTGFIAQEMLAVYPDSVGEDSETGMLHIGGWDRTSARLVKAIQELHAELQALKAS